MWNKIPKIHFVSVIPMSLEIGFQVDNILFINVFYLLYVAQVLVTSSG